MIPPRAPCCGDRPKAAAAMTNEDCKAIMVRIFFLVLALVLSAARPALPQGSGLPGAGWSTVERDGVHWLAGPDGKLFYSKGVNIVSPGRENEKSRSGQAYCWNNFYASLEQWRTQVGGQIRNWGFNTLGGWSDCAPELGLALTVDLELGRNSRFHWFDPFDPRMERETAERARELTAPYRNLPNLIGYYSDNEVGWWNAPLFSWFLKADWQNHTKRFLWEMIRDHYGGSWEKLLEDFVPQNGAAGFDSLKEAGAALKLRAGGSGIRLVDKFMGACAKRYYELMHGAIRAAHPGALVLGDRLPLYYHQDAVLAMGDNVDVISTNYNVDVADGWVAPYYFEGLQKLSRKPVLVTEFFFAAEENRSGNRNETARNVFAKPGHLMTVDTQAQRAWGAGNALLNFARFPNVVGAHWFQYCDEPLGGREDGEDYNMGLIDTAGRPYEELTQSFRVLNPVLESVHRGAGSRTSNTARPEEPGEQIRVARADRPIDLSDRSLIEWEKEKTRLRGFRAPPPRVPFGDVHLAWAPQGFYLFSLADIYVDPDFLDHRGDFPHSEAFQVHFTAQAEGKRKHLAVFLLPKSNPRYPDGFEIVPELFRMEGPERAEHLPVAGHVQRIEKSLPHVAFEAFLPARWFGLDELRPGMRLGINIALVSFFREFTMALAGKPDASEIADPTELKTIVLE